MVDGEPVPLSPQQLAIFRVLYVNPGKWISPGQLIEAVWCDDNEPDGACEALRKQINRLRHALGREAIQSQWGFGYRFSP